MMDTITDEARRAHRLERLHERLAGAQRSLASFQDKEPAIRDNLADAAFEFHLVERRPPVAGLDTELRRLAGERSDGVGCHARGSLGAVDAGVRGVVS